MISKKILGFKNGFFCDSSCRLYVPVLNSKDIRTCFVFGISYVLVGIPVSPTLKFRFFMGIQKKNEYSPSLVGKRGTINCHCR